MASTDGKRTKGSRVTPKGGGAQGSRSRAGSGGSKSAKSGNAKTGTSKPGTAKASAEKASGEKAGGEKASREKAAIESKRYTPPGVKSSHLPPSPTWVPVLMFVLLGIGSLVIVLNYMGVLPGETKQMYTFGGLGLILGGIITATQYR